MIKPCITSQSWIAAATHRCNARTACICGSTGFCGSTINPTGFGWSWYHGFLPRKCVVKKRNWPEVWLKARQLSLNPTQDSRLKLDFPFFRACILRKTNMCPFIFLAVPKISIAHCDATLRWWNLRHPTAGLGGIFSPMSATTCCTKTIWGEAHKPRISYSSLLKDGSWNPSDVFFFCAVSINPIGSMGMVHIFTYSYIHLPKI